MCSPPSVQGEHKVRPYGLTPFDCELVSVISDQYPVACFQFQIGGLSRNMLAREEFMVAQASRLCGPVTGETPGFTRKPKAHVQLLGNALASQALKSSKRYVQAFKPVRITKAGATPAPGFSRFTGEPTAHVQLLGLHTVAKRCFTLCPTQLDLKPPPKKEEV